MKKILTIGTATVFLLGCTQQRVEMPVNGTGTTKTEMTKINTSKINKHKAIGTELKKPEGISMTESLGDGIMSNPIMNMVGSALITGLISGLVSKALQ